MHELQKQWVAIAKKGLCTMHPWFTKWAMPNYGQEVNDSETSKPMWGLTKLCAVVAPHRKDLLERHHEALADAQMSRLVYVAYLDLARRAGTTFD